MPHVALAGPELEENLSLRSLAAALTRAGLDCDIVPFDDGRDIGSVVARLLSAGSPPAVIGLSLAFQPRARDFLALAVALRREGYRGHLTAGGHFATFAYREILGDFPEIDTVLRFEADHALPALARAVVSAGDTRLVPGLAYREVGAVRVNVPGPAPDLATLPWPDRRGSTARYLGHRVAAMVGSRGCYARCAFCCIAAWHAAAGSVSHRERPVHDVADEMAWLRRERDVQVFVFHDDNFFLPRRDDTMARITELGDALERRGVRDAALVVKARPNDLDDRVVGTMRDRLGLIRLFLGVENATPRGLKTLGRGVHADDNARALDLLERHGVYPCFNMLVFDPDSTVDDLEENLCFMERYAEVPHNFGRVELYAGTPLLAQLQAQSRCSGDYLGWDYPLSDARIQRVFDLTMAVFPGRNFSERSTPHRLMGTRFLVEVAKRFHPGAYRPQWQADVRALTRRLVLDSVAVVREIIAFVKADGPDAAESEHVAAWTAHLERIDREIQAEAGNLELAIQCAAVQGDALRSEASTEGGSHGQAQEARSITV